LQILSALSFVIIGDSCNYLGIDSTARLDPIKKRLAATESNQVGFCATQSVGRVHFFV
jgi:hypothetical protein